MSRPPYLSRLHNTDLGPIATLGTGHIGDAIREFCATDDEAREIMGRIVPVFDNAIELAFQVGVDKVVAEMNWRALEIQSEVRQRVPFGLTEMGQPREPAESG